MREGTRRVIARLLFYVLHPYGAFALNVASLTYTVSRIDAATTAAGGFLLGSATILNLFGIWMIWPVVRRRLSPGPPGIPSWIYTAHGDDELAKFLRGLFMADGFSDLADLPEDERIEVIANWVKRTGKIAGVFVDDTPGKADRYVGKMQERHGGAIRTIDTTKVGNGMIAIRFGPQRN